MNKNKLTYGASVFDFDETVGFSNNVVHATRGAIKVTITSDEWPKCGEKMISEGWLMDFTDFNKVTDGKAGPLIQKLKNQINKYGNCNVYILTARHSDSEEAIHKWLLQQNIELKPKQGTIVIWPAAWTHSHYGKPVLDEHKYIITGWGSHVKL